MTVPPIAPNLRPKVLRRPEILAPAGDIDSMRAALFSGANAVFFGLDEGFNARSRAKNFPVARLQETVEMIHRAGAKAYVTMNTLVFEAELQDAEDLIRACARCGVDALLVQDPAVSLLARAICPSLDLHASTQMTISSAEAAEFARTLGIKRVVIPRELSVSEIDHFKKNTDLEIEVFIHGALCVAWSGQCLSSEVWGGRSANRGQCAQSCRMPYDLIVDGKFVPQGEIKYFLSPKDLAGYRAVPALMETGVHSLKIEGRLKGPAYVATVIRGLSHWMDAIVNGIADQPEPQQVLAKALSQMMVTYSRGFGDGFLAGVDHQNLVDGRFPRHRGYLVGTVQRVQGKHVWVEKGPLALRHFVRGKTLAGVVASPLPPLGGAPDSSTGAAVADLQIRPGMGVCFDAGKPESHDEAGGPIFETRREGSTWILGFGIPGPDLTRVQIGDRVWLNSDPEITRFANQAAQGEVREGKNPLVFRISGKMGEPLRIEVRSNRYGELLIESAESLVAASGKGLSSEIMSEKLCALGGTPFYLEALQFALEGDLHFPVSQLKVLRRKIVEEFERRLALPRKDVETEPVLRALKAKPFSFPRAQTEIPELVVLCRTMDQLEAVIALGFKEVELDWMELVGLGEAVDRAKKAGLKVTIATMRVQKPGEDGFDRRIACLEPEAVLVRNWGALMQFRKEGALGRRNPIIHGDFSLNVTNSLSAKHVLALGLDTLTAAHDLNSEQLVALLREVPPALVTVVVHHHISTFHTEHCVYAQNLSPGKDFHSCGRPCEKHRVALRDHLGNEHPVVVDVGCRNTVFNAQAQSAAALVPSLIKQGVKRFRVEFVWESGHTATDVLQSYQALLIGSLSSDELVRRIGVYEQFGVTQGTMAR